MSPITCESKNKQSNSKYEFKSRLTSTFFIFYPIDLDQDDEDEIVNYTSGQIDVRDLESLNILKILGFHEIGDMMLAH